MVFVLIAVSIISFLVIQAPPGDFISSYISNLQGGGEKQHEYVQVLRDRYGLDKPLHIQYWKWVSGMVRGDFGWSFNWQMPVSEVIAKRLPYSILLNVLAVLLIYLIAVPIGIYSAVKQYTVGDYLISISGFIGLSIPDFLAAIVIMYVGYSLFGISIGGLYSQEYAYAPWSLAKAIDLLKHLALPVLVVSMGGMATVIRVMRATLLDELGKNYVLVARAKGMQEAKLIVKHPVRVAINPIVSLCGWILPTLVSGSVIVELVFNLPTIGPVFMNALLTQDMYMAGTIVLLLSFLILIGTLVSDILLVLVDPRIRYE